jgi:hypothetical protein
LQYRQGCNTVVVVLTIVSCFLYHGPYIADNVLFLVCL